MEDIDTELTTKLKLLQYTSDKTPEVIQLGGQQALQRQREALEKRIAEVQVIKLKAEETKIVAGVSVEDLNIWSATVDAQLATVDVEVVALRKYIEQLILTEKNQKHEEAAAMEAHAVTTARAEQLQFEQSLLKQKLEYEQRILEAREKSNETTTKAAKMPKLVITKFNGTPQDWLRFWGQFEAEIDNSNAHPVTKFSYLREYLDPKIRGSIEGLPFTSEGYVKAKEYLQKRYGKSSEVVGAYVRNILELPTINERDEAKIHEFYDSLVFNVTSLETLGRLKDIEGATSFTLDKLEVIKGELVQANTEWEDWTFQQFLEALRVWTVSNRVKTQTAKKSLYSSPNHKSLPPKSRAFNTSMKEPSPQRSCVYCESEEHKSLNCDKIVGASERKKVLGDKRLCFNCAGTKHRANDCKSHSRCQNCQRKHHTSICDQTRAREQGMTANHVGNTAVTHPVVMVEVDGLKFRALLDSGASHSYASASFIKQIRAHRKASGIRQIAMLMGVTTKRMDVYNVCMQAVTSNFMLSVDVTKVEKKELLTLENPHYERTLAEYSHLKGVEMDDKDERDQLPVHLILGANDFAKIRTSVRMRVGRRGEPVAEFTRFGWALMSPGSEKDLSHVYLATSSTLDYERLCSLDVLGLADTPTGDQGAVLQRVQRTADASSGGLVRDRPALEGEPPSPSEQSQWQPAPIGFAASQVAQI